MILIAHLSDLHFGTEDAFILEALLEDLQRSAPSLVIVSGDLTQRARAAEFAAARTFLERIPFPRLSVPGNHDVPLYDFIRRFAFPLARYQRFIHPALDPFHADRCLAVLGLNTARSLTWKSGRISFSQIERIRATLGPLPESLFKIVVTHHPFIPPPGEAGAGIDLVGRASAALEVIDSCGVDLLLAGHLHHGYTGDVRAYYPASKRSIVVAQAGTACSRRTRHEPNAYNAITLDGDAMEIRVRSWQAGRFQPERAAEYQLKGSEWRLVARGAGSRLG